FPGCHLFLGAPAFTPNVLSAGFLIDGAPVGNRPFSKLIDDVVTVTLCSAGLTQGMATDRASHSLLPPREGFKTCDSTLGGCWARRRTATGAPRKPKGDPGSIPGPMSSP